MGAEDSGLVPGLPYLDLPYLFCPISRLANQAWANGKILRHMVLGEAGIPESEFS
jgi:hypothetical protein